MLEASKSQKLFLILLILPTWEKKGLIVDGKELSGAIHLNSLITIVSKWKIKRF